MDRRIAQPKNCSKLLDRLTSPLTGGRPALFRKKQKALMFAAALGYSMGTRKPLERDASTAIRFDIFQTAADDGFVNALAVAETKDLHVLSEERDEERATIFEEYAHTGLLELEKRCFARAGDPLDALVQMTEDAREPTGDVPGIDSSILSRLME